MIIYSLNLTEEELEFVYTRCLRKAMRLEEAHLKDIPCYDLANSIMWKINDLKKPESAPFPTVEVSQAEYFDLREQGAANPNILYQIKEKEK